MNTTSRIFIILFFMYPQVGSAEIGAGHLPTGAIWVYAGVEGGYASHRSVVPGEVSRTGYQFNVKLSTPIFHYDYFVVDGGMGLWHQYVSREGTRANGAFGISFDVNARYQITNRWQFGLAVPFVFGNNVGMAELGSPLNTAVYLGPVLLYEAPFESTRVRFGIQGLVGISGGNRSQYLAQVVFQYGFPISAASESEKTADDAESVHSLIEVKESSIRFAFGTDVLPFTTSSVTVAEEVRPFLKKVAEALMEHQGDWEFLRIEAHTDAGGNAKENKTYSAKRAEAVLKQLVYFGVPTDRASATGLASDKPRVAQNHPQAIAKNRRIELVLLGVKNTSNLTSKIDRIYKSADKFDIQ